MLIVFLFVFNIDSNCDILVASSRPGGKFEGLKGVRSPTSMAMTFLNLYL